MTLEEGFIGRLRNYPVELSARPFHNLKVLENLQVHPEPSWLD
jgi:hypothetical protein